MNHSAVTPAVSAAAFSLAVFALCVGAFVPPFMDHTVSSVPLIVTFGIAIAVSFALHVAFVGIAAHRADRSAVLWGVLTVVLFPVGSIVGLILFEWFSTQTSGGTAGRLARTS